MILYYYFPLDLLNDFKMQQFFIEEVPEYRVELSLWGNIPVWCHRPIWCHVYDEHDLGYCKLIEILPLKNKRMETHSYQKWTRTWTARCGYRQCLGDWGLWCSESRNISEWIEWLAVSLRVQQRKHLVCLHPDSHPSRSDQPSPTEIIRKWPLLLSYSLLHSASSEARIFQQPPSPEQGRGGPSIPGSSHSSGVPVLASLLLSASSPAVGRILAPSAVKV